MLAHFPAPLHRALLHVGHRLRLRWWRLAGRDLHGCNAIVCNPAGKILLIRHSYQSPHRWMLPGGGMRQGESGVAAATREVAEETGCAMREGQTIGIDTEVLSGCQNHVAVVAGMTTDTPRPDQREVIEARFFGPQVLPATLSSHARRRIERWLQWKDHDAVAPPPGDA